MFTSLQQKDISTLLTCLWHADPSQAKWTILAKAYSIICDDKGKNNVPLDSLLTINAPYIGIIPSQEYFEKLGWQFSTDENNGTALVRGPINAIVSQDLLTTNLSDGDIVQHCYDCGYVSGDGNVLVVTEGSTMTMATTAQLTEASSDHLVTPGGDGSNQESNGHASNSFSTASQNTDAGNIAPGVGTEGEAAERDFEKKLIESRLKDLNKETKKVEVTDHAAQLGINVLGRVLLESGDEYPFNSQFDPDNLTDLHYNPFMGDLFNAFNMSNYLNKDMFG